MTGNESSCIAVDQRTGCSVSCRTSGPPQAASAVIATMAAPRPYEDVIDYSAAAARKSCLVFSLRAAPIPTRLDNDAHSFQSFSLIAATSLGNFEIKPLVPRLNAISRIASWASGG